jgi:hypothetical protein
MWNGSRQIIMTTRMASHIQRFLVCVALAFIALTGVTTQSSAAEGSGTLDIVVVVSQQNPIASLSRDHIEDIFLGRTQTFPNGLRAVPVDQAEGSAVREHFKYAPTGPESCLPVVAARHAVSHPARRCCEYWPQIPRLLGT